MLTKSKRILSAVLAVFMLLTVLLPMSASAADVTMDLSKCEVSWDYTLTDKEGKTFSAAYGLKRKIIHSAMRSNLCGGVCTTIPQNAPV